MSADLAIIADDPSVLERAADPGEFLMLACERAKAWLAEALANGEIDKIAEMKAQAEAIRVYTVSKQLGHDAQLSATEIVRRAERGIGLAIRRGQENGTIRDRGNPNPKVDQAENCVPGPTDFASKGELYGGGSEHKPGIYDLTDDVTDEQFNDALAGARADGNLGRANVARKLRRSPPDPVPAGNDKTPGAAVRRRQLIREWAQAGYSSRQIGERLGISAQRVRIVARDNGVVIGADAVVGGMQNIDSNRVVSETVGAMEGIASGIRLVDIEDLDAAQAEEWAASLTESVRALNRLIRQLRELTHD